MAPIALAFCLCVGADTASAAPAPGAAGQPFERSRTYWQAGGAVGQAWFICSALDGADVIVATRPDGKGRISLVQPTAKDPPSDYRLGRPDPGAGQIYWPLSTLSGQSVGALHAFNPGALDDPKFATTATFTSIRVAGAQWNCRWLERTRLIGFSDKRTMAVTQAPDGTLEYRTYDFKDAGRLKRIDAGAEQATTASLDIKGGRSTPGGFAFAHSGFAYDVAASPRGATIEVRKSGRLVQREPLIAWTIAPAP